jgi:glutathione S-transferase
MYCNSVIKESREGKQGGPAALARALRVYRRMERAVIGAMASGVVLAALRWGALRRSLASGAMPRLTLYGSSKFRPFRNTWMLEEMGVPYEHAAIRPRSAEAKAVNTFGKIPTLRDGECVITESVAINTFLGDRYRSLPGCADLVPPPGTDLRGKYEALTCCLLAELDAQALWIHRKHASEVAAFIGGSDNPDATEVARKHADKVIGVLATDLASSDGDYLLGSSFSAADILFVHCLDWAESIGWAEKWQSPADEVMSNLAAYIARCRGREAYQRAKALP